MYCLHHTYMKVHTVFNSTLHLQLRHPSPSAPCESKITHAKQQWLPCTPSLGGISQVDFGTILLCDISFAELHMSLVNLHKMCILVQDAYCICYTRIHLQWFGCNKTMSLLQWRRSCAWQGTHSRAPLISALCNIDCIPKQCMCTSLSYCAQHSPACKWDSWTTRKVSVSGLHRNTDTVHWINVNWYELCQLYTFQHDTLCRTGAA